MMRLKFGLNAVCAVLLLLACAALVPGLHASGPPPVRDVEQSAFVVEQAGVTAEDAPAQQGFPFSLLGVGFAIGMVALAKDRDTPKRDGKLLGYPVAAGQRIYAGALVVLQAGYARGGLTALNLIAVGRANGPVDNTGGAVGAATIEVERGVFRFAQDGTITQANVGATCFIVDDQTVAAGNGGGTRSAAGIVRGLEPGGVWVEI